MSLFESGRIGDIPVDNRGVFRPVRTKLVNDGEPTDALSRHLAARAAGGVGLIVGPASMLVHPSASGAGYIDAHRESVVDPLGNVVDAVHDAGSPIIGQLTHTGGEESGDWNMQEQLAPSAAPSDAAYETPKPMSKQDIDRVKAGFVCSAVNLEAAGFDGVELAANAFSVLRQFLSPRFNTREDSYGGDLTGRVRLLNETIAAVSDAVTIPVGVHLSLSELVYGGYTFDDAPAIIDELSGYDYLSCTVGTRSTFNQAHTGVADETPPLVEAIERTVSHVETPLMGRVPFTTLADASRLRESGVDFVCFTRQLLADPDTLTATAAGESYDRCIQCNQTCLRGVYGHAHGESVACVINPRTGREGELPPLDSLDSAAIPKRVLVVGGGPAGLRFAAVASRRGHDVTLRERDTELGGQLRTVAGVAEPFERAIDDLTEAAHEQDVTVETETEVTADQVETEFDVVVVATGGRPATTLTHDADIAGQVTDGYDVLAGTTTGKDVLVYDDNRWVIVHQVAETLLDRNCSVEIVSRDHYPGFRTEQANLPGYISSLQAQGAEFCGNHRLVAVDTNGTVTLDHTLTGESTQRTPDDVVLVGRRVAEESLYHELKESVECYRVGDAVAPRKLDRAYYDGELLGRRL